MAMSAMLSKIMARIPLDFLSILVLRGNNSWDTAIASHPEFPDENYPPTRTGSITSPRIHPAAPGVVHSAADLRERGVFPRVRGEELPGFRHGIGDAPRDLAHLRRGQCQVGQGE